MDQDNTNLFGFSSGSTPEEQNWNEVISAYRKRSQAYRDEIYGSNMANSREDNPPTQKTAETTDRQAEQSSFYPFPGFMRTGIPSTVLGSLQQPSEEPEMNQGASDKQTQDQSTGSSAPAGGRTGVFGGMLSNASANPGQADTGTDNAQTKPANQAQGQPRFVRGPYTSDDNIRKERFNWRRKVNPDVDCTGIGTPENSWLNERICVDSTGLPWEMKHIDMNNEEIYAASKHIRTSEMVRNWVGSIPWLGPLLNTLTEERHQEWKAKELDAMNNSNNFYRPYINTQNSNL